MAQQIVELTTQVWRHGLNSQNSQKCGRQELTPKLSSGLHMRKHADTDTRGGGGEAVMDPDRRQNLFQVTLSAT